MGDRRMEAVAEDPIAAGEPPRAQENPLVLAHRLLRGRYMFAIPLAILVAPLGAIVGYRLRAPVYSSQGLVQVQSSIPKILYDTEENAPLDSFDAYVEAQASFLRDRRVLDKALTDPKLRQAGWPGGPDGLQALERAIDVSRGNRSALISVQANHKNPALAQAAVNAVLRAYQELYGERDGLVKTSRERALEEVEQSLSQEAQSLRLSIFQVAEETGSADTLRRLHETRSLALEELEQRINDLQMQIDQRVAAGETVDGSSANGAGASRDLSLAALAARDSELARLVAARDDVQARIDADSAHFGENHRHMVDLRKQLATLEDRIKSRSDVVAAGVESASHLEGSAATATASLASLKQLESQLNERRERLKADVRELGRKRLQLTQYEGQLDDVNARLSQARHELEALRVESRNAAIGRVTIASWGEIPFAPSKDRRIPLAALGAGGLAGGVLGLFGLAGLLDRRWRFIDDADWLAHAPLLGSLPDLKSGASVDREIAAASIHQLRNVLSLDAAGSDRKIYAITSATPEAGKTSLSLALGLSFAASGCRTLLVDADLVGGGLTTELGLRDAPGLVQVFQEGGVNGQIRRLGSGGLHALPRGARDGFEPEHLSHGQMRQALAGLRERFDVILLDTGPLLGSLEANLAVSAADETILVAPRGQSVKLVRSALERIQELGGRCAGVVFNRARPSDVHRSISRSSILSPYMSASGGRRRSRGESELQRSALAGVMGGEELVNKERASA